ncbi:sensor histidine kinase [Pontiella sulfatireligans]|uniref:histidine kinase n=1 Tax=Pontiella sulfatireligans TaxID=2750658 RepID=A0A6C2UNT2_9BACT|nr:HAMP domain-containing sensor histidine kinase [Pontiella sulfatireligans]VGO20997.1 Alkaline phosphatase synthesis sensor protein PhoR [Pontiella sulfatireligans]
MRSKSKGSWRRTFQFRLVLYYFVLTLSVLVVTYGISHLVLYNQLQSETRIRMNQAMEFLTERYFGSSAEQDPQIIPNSEWPASVQTNFFKAFPKVMVGMIEAEAQHDGRGYEVIASTGTERLEILISAAGQMWISHSESIEEVFHSLETAIANPLDDASVSAIKLLLLDPAGGRLAETSPSAFSPARIAALRRELEDRTEALLTSPRHGLFMAREMYDGNVLCISNDFSFGQLELRRWWEFFLGLLAIFVPGSIFIGWFLSWRAMAGVKRVTAAARTLDAGHLQHRVGSRRGGTEVEELCDAFNSMASRIEALVQELRDVTANIAHDMRTPITRIRGLLETMEWNCASEAECEEVAGMVIEECDHLAPLINDILEVARAETGVLVLHPEPFDLSAEAQKATAVFSGSAQEKKITLQSKFPAEPVRLVGDRRRIQRVIANLLDNAIKFTPDGGRVNVQLSADQNEAHLEVADNGPGIPLSERERAFERFYRCSASRTTPGNGLGLSLVKAFVNAHGGTVQIEAADPAGCIVSLRLPLGD